jgi:hypothetical protein
VDALRRAGHNKAITMTRRNTPRVSFISFGEANQAIASGLRETGIECAQVVHERTGLLADQVSADIVGDRSQRRGRVARPIVWASRKCSRRSRCNAFMSC